MTFRRVLHAFTMTFIIVGMFYFYQLSDFSYDVYQHDNQTYYAFTKWVDILLMLCIIFPLRELKNAWVCIGTFFAVRLLWEILAVKDYATASRPSIIFILFLSDLLCLIIILIIQIKRNRSW